MKRVIFSERDPIEEAIPPLTKDQFFTLVDALDLEDNATIDDVIAKVLELVEATDSKVTQDDEAPVAASDLQALRQRVAEGDKAIKKLEYLDAEKLVDDAIHRGKVLAAKREEFIQAAIADRKSVEFMFSHIPDEAAVPLNEKGRGGSDEARGVFEGKGWVR